jgi:stalled ribosome rescue protein Dom34
VTQTGVKKIMKANAGLWIDHREAVIVELKDQGTETKRIQSSAEQQLRRSGEPDHGRFEAQEVPADDSRQREYTGQLARYYDAIVMQLRHCGSILIFGPGETKGELKKRFEKQAGALPLIVLKTTDKMTEGQIVSMVRQHFSLPAGQPAT